jgi:hypothetical protein
VSFLEEAWITANGNKNSKIPYWCFETPNAVHNIPSQELKSDSWVQ